MIKEIAILGLILIFILTGIFHMLVMMKVIPYKMVWGGRLKSDTEMYRFEAGSLLVNLVFMFVILVKAQILPVRINDTLINWALWIMFGLFVLNTIGNLFSKNRLEKLIFTPVTILLAVFILILLF